jgi:hypothetical protein
MAMVRIMFWKDIPYAVRAFDNDGRISKQLPEVFEAAVDKAAMVTGMTEQADYQSGFRWGEEEERPGNAEVVSKTVHDELIAAYPPNRLARMATSRAADNGSY